MEEKTCWGEGKEVFVAPRSSILYAWAPLKHSAFQHVIYSLGWVISETQVWRNALRFFKKLCFLIVPLRVDVIKLNNNNKKKNYSALLWIYDQCCDLNQVTVAWEQDLLFFLFRVTYIIQSLHGKRVYITNTFYFLGILFYRNIALFLYLLLPKSH